MHVQAGNNNNMRNPLPISYTTELHMSCKYTSFHDFWHCHPYIILYFNENVFTLVIICNKKMLKNIGITVSKVEKQVQYICSKPGMQQLICCHSMVPQPLYNHSLTSLM